MYTQSLVCVHRYPHLNIHTCIYTPSACMNRHTTHVCIHICTQVYVSTCTQCIHTPTQMHTQYKHLHTYAHSCVLLHAHTGVHTSTHLSACFCKNTPIYVHMQACLYVFVCICMYLCPIFLIQSSVNGHFGCFPVVLTLSATAMNMEVQIFLQVVISYPLDVYPEKELLGHRWLYFACLQESPYSFS